MQDRLLVCYLLHYSHTKPVEHCGIFDSMKQFHKFVEVEATYGRIMSGVTFTKKVS